MRSGFLPAMLFFTTAAHAPPAPAIRPHTASLAWRTACSTSDGEAANTIRARLARWVEQANADDRQGMNEVWAPGLIGWFPRYPAFTDSAAAVVAGVDARSIAPAPSRYEIVIDDIAASGEMAAVHDIWTETKTFAGNRSVRRTIRGSELWKCQPDGRWRIARYVSAPEAWSKITTP
jgi:ketosteroid isomerase-like protein